MTTQHFNFSDNSLIKRVAQAAFPEYTGRKLKVSYGTKQMSIRSYWDGGSRTYFTLVNLADMTTLSAPSSHPIFDNVPYNVDAVVIPGGCVIVAHSIFCGKDMGLTIYTPVDAPLLTDGNEVSDDLIWLLIATASRKSSYAGIKDYRAYELRQKFGWSQAKIEQLRNEAIEKGYMAKNKALTTEGKNIVANHPQRYRF